MENCLKNNNKHLSKSNSNKKIQLSSWRQDLLQDCCFFKPNKLAAECSFSTFRHPWCWMERNDFQTENKWRFLYHTTEQRTKPFPVNWPHKPLGSHKRPEQKDTEREVYLWGSGAGCLSPSARWWCSTAAKLCTQQTERWDGGAGDSSGSGLPSETPGGSTLSLDTDDGKTSKRSRGRRRRREATQRNQERHSYI